MLVRNVMTAPVISVAPSTSIGQAAQIMLSHRISGLPVVTPEGALVGVVSEGDLLHRGELGTERKRSSWLEFFVSTGQSADEYVRANSRKVADVMSSDVVTTGPDASLDDVVETMGRRRIKRVPVLENGKLVGIVARSDVLRALAKSLSDVPAAPTDDEAIQAAIVAEIAKQGWGGRGLIRVHVTKGVAELEGTIFDERVRAAARVVAENSPGVKSVLDRLVFVEPISGVVIWPGENINGTGVAI